MIRKRGASGPAGSVALVLGAVCALTLPFVAKPFHLDDDVYLKGATQIAHEPLNPLGGTQAILGQTMPTYHFTQHPPLVSYYIALVRFVTGDVVAWQLHLAFLPFALLAAVGMLVLARRFTTEPTLATLMLVATPAFLVASLGLMTDMPFLGLSLTAAAVWIRGVDRSHPGLLFLAGGLLGLTCLVQYRGLLLVPLVLSYVLLHRQRPGLALAALSPAAVLLGLWSVWNWAQLGVAHLLDAAGWIPFTPERLLRDGLAYVSFLGGATVFPPLVLWIGRRRLANPWFGTVVAILLVLVAVRWAPDHVGAARWLLLVFLTTGAAMLWCIVPTGELVRRCVDSFREPSGGGGQRARDQVFLVTMAGAALASQIVLNLFASVRSLLLALPFLILLLMRSVEDEPPRRSGTRRWWLHYGLAGTLALGVAVSLADMRLALAQRDLARAVNRDVGHGARVWFTGEW
ncbi:MAG: glycosyltransferase family 39 protein, partial [Anaerolineae bacterium]